MTEKITYDSCFRCDEFTIMYDENWCEPCYEILIETVEDEE